MKRVLLAYMSELCLMQMRKSLAFRANSIIVTKGMMAEMTETMTEVMTEIMTEVTMEIMTEITTEILTEVVRRR